eukprot:TRINITY_DN16535_c0_g1_i1.p1 TRINITY_DN16535_c0_g1~~TRINITY_DN16535_c0_g1_i1.p1  ORF type:complete len:1150 (+),score=225.64 TRINITY_DN16535_c0_g1_i1:71-3520(+)
MGGNKGGKGKKKGPTMAVGVSKENKDLVMSVLHNIREGCDEEVDGLKVNTTASVKMVNSNPGRNALVRNGIPESVAEKTSSEFSHLAGDELMWKAVELSMEALASELGSTLATDPEDGTDQQQEELDSLTSMEEEVVRLPDDVFELRIAAHPGCSIHLRGCNHLHYPSKLPLAKFASRDATPQVRYSVHQQLWTKMIELVGTPVMFPLLIEMPTIIETAEAESPQSPKTPIAEKAKGKPAAGKNNGGKKGKKQGRIVKGGRMDVSSGTEAQRPTMGVPEVFPELSREEISKIAVTTSEPKDKWEGIKPDPTVDKKLQSEYNKRISNKEGLPDVRAKLPAAKQCDSIVQIVRDSQVVLVTGETGCGKTTQVPQFILDSFLKNGEGSKCKMICTQPRRIAAMSIAKRVAQERGSAIGQQVGYSIRLESKQSQQTRLLFCTTGVLLRKLQSEPLLQSVSHVVVDEVHERSLDSDFLLIFLKELLPKRPDLKIILMSASVNAELFADYFDSCPVVHIPGFTHPVAIHHLEDILDTVDYSLEDDSEYSIRAKHLSYFDVDESASKGQASTAHKKSQEADKKYAEDLQLLADKFPSCSPKSRDTLLRLDQNTINNDLIIALVEFICFSDEYKDVEGAILIFLPGMQEINSLYDDFESVRKLKKSLSVNRLHSSVSNEEQEAVFCKPPKGLRKVVLSTNIAETSVTIDDIVFVIDTGKHKENRFDAGRGMQKLVQCWVSQANAKQRKGRAGRVRPGHCFRMYTSDIHQNTMAQFQDCEMSRVPLHSLLLQLRVLDFDCKTDFEILKKAIESPSENAVKASRTTLREIGAIGPKNDITSLGMHLANLPLEPKVGKLILFGCLLRCLDPCLTIAAALQSKSPFSASQDQKLEASQARMGLSQGCRSDHITSFLAYNAWKVVQSEDGRNAERQFCRKHFLSIPVLKQILQTKRQYYSLLAGQGFATLDKNSKEHIARDSVGEKFIFDFGGKDLNRYSTTLQAIRAALTAAFTPSIVETKTIKMRKDTVAVFNENGNKVMLHPSSVCSTEKTYPSPLLVYSEKVMTSQVFLREVTNISPQMLLLFAIDMSYDGPLVCVNRWIRYTMDVDVLSVISELRKELQKMLSQLITSPDMTVLKRHENIIAAVMKLLKEERTSSHR